MTRFAKYKKDKKPIGEDATPWNKMKERIPREERRLEKKQKRQMKKMCFRCRMPGHSMNECTVDIPEKEKKSQDIKTGICYKCGSTEHRLAQCTSKGNTYTYATCFICGKQGHWSRLCPDNPNGLYPNGGCCNECGSKTHFKRDCPTLLKKQGIDDQKLPCLTSTTNNVDDNIEINIEEKPSKIKKSSKRLKIVKF